LTNMISSKDKDTTGNRIMPGIQSFAWSPDRQRVAVCPQSNEILIFETGNKPNIKDWKLVEVLREHYSLVNSLQWHPKTNWLLSASTDRGIIVWKPDSQTKKLIPSLCNIKEQKSNLDGAWNSRGDKFCVGATSGHVFIGTWDEAVQFWVAVSVTEEPPLGKPLHKASVMSVRFDPGSSRVVASASADGMVYITSCYDPEFDTEGTGPFA